LSHLIDEGHVVTNPQPDTNQRAWSFKILQDVMQQPICKVILIDHLNDKDTVSVWKEICQAMGMSVTAQFISQSISMHLTSTRPTPTAGWKGSQQSFPLDCSEKTQQCNDMSVDPHSLPGRLS
jgi:hypothetical protein